MKDEAARCEKQRRADDNPAGNAEAGHQIALPGEDSQHSGCDQQPDPDTPGEKEALWHLGRRAQEEFQGPAQQAAEGMLLHVVRPVELEEIEAALIAVTCFPGGNPAQLERTRHQFRLRPDLVPGRMHKLGVVGPCCADKAPQRIHRSLFANSMDQDDCCLRLCHICPLGKGRLSSIDWLSMAIQFAVQGRGWALADDQARRSANGNEP